MKITNFRDCVKLPKVQFEPNSYAAKVDVTTGMWFWKKTKTREVGTILVAWHFLDTGEYTPGFEVERLFDIWQIKERRKYKAPSSGPGGEVSTLAVGGSIPSWGAKLRKINDHHS